VLRALFCKTVECFPYFDHPPILLDPKDVTHNDAEAEWYRPVFFELPPVAVSGLQS
jgi:hypothetical protein